MKKKLQGKPVSLCVVMTEEMLKQVEDIKNKIQLETELQQYTTAVIRLLILKGIESFNNKK